MVSDRNARVAMIKPIRLYSLMLAGLFAVNLAGCASFGKCAPENCAGDASITADVREAIAEHPELGAPAALRVQTINGVVYLNGQVDTEFERRNAESLVSRVANVRDVVNSLDVRNTGR
jgi:osmotically-inducible protein OsmY